jgi:hypothetical protein
MSIELIQASTSPDVAAVNHQEREWDSPEQVQGSDTETAGFFAGIGASAKGHRSRGRERSADDSRVQG